MTSLKNLSSPQLNKMLLNTKAELNRRENITLAQKEIASVLKKYKLSLADITNNGTGLNAGLKPQGKATQKVVKNTKSSKIAKKNQKHAPVAAKTDQRSSVKAKYRDPSSQNTWSGRGRSPNWVKSLCEKEKIDIKAFKSDKRFQV